jgi:hypothetical protein
MIQRKKYIEEKTNELDKRFKNLNVKDRKERLKLMEDLVLLEKEEKKLVTQRKKYIEDIIYYLNNISKSIDLSNDKEFNKYFEVLNILEKEMTLLKKQEKSTNTVKMGTTGSNIHHHDCINDNEFCNRFVSGLLNKYGLAVEEFCRDYQKHSYVKLPDGVKKHYCVCGSPIQHIYVMEHKKTKHKIEIGRVCVTKFLPEEFRKKTCGICNKVHRNRKDNFCNDCRKMTKHYLQTRSHVKHIGEWKCYTNKYNNIARRIYGTRYTYNHIWKNDKEYLKWMWFNNHAFTNSSTTSSKIRQWIEEKIYTEHA